MSLPLRLLLVEDSEDDMGLLLRELRNGGFEPDCLRVETREAMDEALRGREWDAVVADYSMPHFSGLAALELLKESGLDLPFILVSGTIGEEQAVEAMKAGANDYLLKGKLTRLTAAIRRELRDAEERRQRRKAEAQLQFDSLHDALTGLPNRSLFLDRIGLAAERAQRRSGSFFAVLVLDLDRFKVIVDSLGHAVGDQLLVSVARLLEKSANPGDTAARLGRDEFALLLEDIGEIEDARRAAENIQKSLSRPFQLNRKEVFTAASIGIALGSQEEGRPEVFLRDAYAAMHSAKSLGPGRCAVFDRSMRIEAVKLLQLETDLRQAVEQRQFRMYYQPMVNLGTGRTAGFEALLRWQHPRRGLLPPDSFVHQAEENGLINPIGDWALAESCRQMRAWLGQYPGAGPLHLSVNLSIKQLSQPGLVERIGQVLAETGLDPSCLYLEITESAIMRNVEASAELLSQLRARNIRILMDDFGTGYSSLSYLHRLPVDTLKIDRSFVSRLGGTERSDEIVQAIVELAHKLSMDVVAEGIETREQAERLKALSCEYGQGFLFAEPLDGAAAEKRVAAEGARG